MKDKSFNTECVNVAENVFKLLLTLCVVVVEVMGSVSDISISS